MVSKSSGIKTVSKQILVSIICLLLGAEAITIFNYGVKSLSLQWPEGKNYDFITGIIIGSLGLLTLIGYVTWVQFEKAYSPAKVFQVSIKYAHRGAIYVIAFDIFIWLLVGFRVGFLGLIILILIETILIWLLFMVFGVIVGGVNAIHLRIENFDPLVHKRLVSNEADVQAAQMGILPYRQQVREIWGLMFFILLALFFIIVPLWGSYNVTPEMRRAAGRGEPNSALTFVLVILGVGVGVYGMNRSSNLLFNPRISSVEGEITSKRTYQPPRGTRGYNLTCDNQVFSTDAKIWCKVSEKKKYRLWYSRIGNRVYAYESL